MRMTCLVMAVLPFCMSQAWSQSLTLEEGSEVRMQLAHTTTSLFDPQGSPAWLIVSEDVSVDNVVVIRKGAVCRGEVDSLQNKSFGRDGFIKIYVKQVEAVDGQWVDVVNLKSAQMEVGRSNSAKVLISLMAIGAARGPGVIPQGAIFVAGTKKDVEINPDKAVPEPTLTSDGEPIVAVPGTKMYRIDAGAKKVGGFFEVYLKGKASKWKHLDAKMVRVAKIGNLMLPKPIKALSLDEPHRKRRKAMFNWWRVIRFFPSGTHQVTLQIEGPDGESLLSTFDVSVIWSN